MKKIKFNNLDLTLTYEKLDNGLEIFILPKTNVNNIYVTFSTKFGSIYDSFNDKKYPLGIAHFLEHKMFEQKDKTDIFKFYSERGADCNANTSYNKTSYLFSCPNFFKENLNMLLDFVQSPYFTDENVNKEKGIIIQELKMYEDMPEMVLYDKIMKNCFNINPIRYPIIGTIKDINNITKDDLYECYNTFYNPSNMFIVITGNIKDTDAIEIIKENQKNKKFITPTIKLKKYNEPPTVFKKEEIIKLNVSIPKCCVAYKLKIKKDIKNLFYLLTLFDCKFSATSDFVSNLIDKKIINDDLIIDYDDSSDYIILMVIGETNKPDLLLNKIKEQLNNLIINEKEFLRKKKTILASIIYMTENIFSLNNNIVSDIIKTGNFNENKYNDIKELNFDDFNKFIKNLDFSNFTTLIINKKDE